MSHLQTGCCFVVGICCWYRFIQCVVGGGGGGLRCCSSYNRYDRGRCMTGTQILGGEWHHDITDMIIGLLQKINLTRAPSCCGAGIIMAGKLFMKNKHTHVEIATLPRQA